jgi:hypothetical protein
MPWKPLNLQEWYAMKIIELAKDQQSDRRILQEIPENPPTSDRI